MKCDFCDQPNANNDHPDLGYEDFFLCDDCYEEAVISINERKRARKMTRDEACGVLISLGFYEYRIGGGTIGCRYFNGDRLGEIRCQYNDSPPALHVEVHDDFVKANGEAIPGRVQFKVVGAAKELWINATFYSVKREDVGSRIDKIKSVAKDVWEAFYNSQTGGGKDVKEG